MLGWLVVIVAVLAVAGLAGWMMSGQGQRWAPAAEPALPPIPAELETRIWVLLRDRQHIQAVAMVRDELGLDLRRSKQVVDEVEARLPGVVR